MDMGVRLLLALLLRAREAEPSAANPAALGRRRFYLAVACRRSRRAAVRAERARRSSPPTADRNDIDMGCSSFARLLAYARARRSARRRIGRALGRRRFSYLAVAVPAQPEGGGSSGAS